MDGLSIRSGQSILDSGKTVSDIRNDNFNVPMATPNGAKEKSFADTLKEAITDVNVLQKDSDKKMQDLATGKSTDIPQVMMATEKADIAMRMMVQVRNKIIDAYQEVMKMQV